MSYHCFHYFLSYFSKLEKELNVFFQKYLIRFVIPFPYNFLAAFSIPNSMTIMTISYLYFSVIISNFVNFFNVALYGYYFSYF